MRDPKIIAAARKFAWAAEYGNCDDQIAAWSKLRQAICPTRAVDYGWGPGIEMPQPGQYVEPVFAPALQRLIKNAQRPPDQRG